MSGPNRNLATATPKTPNNTLYSDNQIANATYGIVPTNDPIHGNNNKNNTKLCATAIPAPNRNDGPLPLGHGASTTNNNATPTMAAHHHPTG